MQPQSEEHQINVVGVTIQLDKHERQRLQLFRRKCAPGATALQDDQRSEVKEAGQSLNSASHENDERCE